MSRRILIAGIGNVFLGDDGFGVAVAQRLQRRRLPDGVVVMDAGIRGLDLTYALMDDYVAAILVDTVSRGGTPGTLYVIDPVVPEGAAASEPTLLDAHGMAPDRVLAFLRASGSKVGWLRVVGCEPERLGSDDELSMDLSSPVQAAVEAALALIESIVSNMLDTRPDLFGEAPRRGRVHHA